jgi:VWFA-related protein
MVPIRTFLLAILVAAPLMAQTVSESLTVEYVEVPVTVVDRAGNPVRGLTKDNFEIYSQKDHKAISSFETIDFSSPSSLAAAANNPNAHRSFLLLFDLGYTSPNTLQRAQEAARAFVKDTVKRGDLVGVATIDNARGYKLLSNFTTDRAAAVAAIDSPRGYRASDPLQLAAGAGLSKAEADAELAVSGGGRGAEAVEMRAELANVEESNRQQYERQQVHRQIDWLSQLAASLRNIRGRKQIVLLSEGFDSRVISGRGAGDRNQENEDAAAIISGTWYMKGNNVDSDRRFGSTASLNILQVMRQAFTGSDVILNAIDLAGVRSADSNTMGALNKTSDGLSLVAEPTGGTVFKNSNDLSTNFSRMLHQQDYVYVLGFQSSVTSPGKLHDLKVKLLGAPAGAVAHYRLGYFEGGAKQTSTERTLNTADILLRDIPQDDVHMASLAVAFPSAGDKAPVPVIVEINGKDLLKSAKGDDLAAEVFIYAFDDHGAVLDRVYHRLALDVKTVGDKLRMNGVKYVATLQLPPGNYAVKSLVRMPATDQKGFTRSDIVVPAAGQMTLLPPMVLDDPQAWLLVQGGQSTTPYPFHVNGEPFIPSVTGRTSTPVRKLAVFVWNAKPDELQWETSPAATLLAQVKSSDATKLVLQLDAGETASRFGVTVRRSGSEALTASTPLGPR